MLGMNGKKAMIGIVNRNDKNYFPEEILAHILRKMKLAAQLKLKKRVGQAVITVPASFNDAQRRAIRDAGLIAGFENVRLLNEPSAAAIAFASQIKVPFFLIYKIYIIDLASAIYLFEITIFLYQSIGCFKEEPVGLLFGRRFFRRRRHLYFWKWCCDCEGDRWRFPSRWPQL